MTNKENGLSPEITAVNQSLTRAGFEELNSVQELESVFEEMAQKIKQPGFAEKFKLEDSKLVETVAFISFLVKYNFVPQINSESALWMWLQSVAPAHSKTIEKMRRGLEREFTASNPNFLSDYLENNETFFQQALGLEIPKQEAQHAATSQNIISTKERDANKAQPPESQAHDAEKEVPPIFNEETIAALAEALSEEIKAAAEKTLSEFFAKFGSTVQRGLERFLAMQPTHATLPPAPPSDEQQLGVYEKIANLPKRQRLTRHIRRVAARLGSRIPAVTLLLPKQAERQPEYKTVTRVLRSAGMKILNSELKLRQALDRMIRSKKDTFYAEGKGTRVFRRPQLQIEMLAFLKFLGEVIPTDSAINRFSAEVSSGSVSKPEIGDIAQSLNTIYENNPDFKGYIDSRTSFFKALLTGGTAQFGGAEQERKAAAATQPESSETRSATDPDQLPEVPPAGAAPEEPESTRKTPLVRARGL